MLNNFCILIPSLNPDEKLKRTVDGLKEAGFTKFVIVDDGSGPFFKKNFPNDDTENIVVLEHTYNKGKGAALKTGFKYILENFLNITAVITVDGDGQHHPCDVKNCAISFEQDFVTLGCRNFTLPEVPVRSRFGNKVTSFVFSALCGLKISDTQTGLRVFPFSVLPFLLTVKGERFEYETNMLLKLKQQSIGIKEVEIKTLYFEENSSSHFKVLRDSIRIYGFILYFLFSSVFSALVDLSGFYIICKFFGEFLGGATVIIATIFARIISSLTNFIINRKFVFDSKDKPSKTIWKYYTVAIPQMLISAICVWVLSTVFKTDAELKTIIKTLVDTILFFISYRVQQTWVFRRKYNKKQ